MRRKKVQEFNPFSPQDRAKIEGKIFSDEWVKENAWMGEENERAMTKAETQQRRKQYDLLVKDCRTKVRMPSFEEWLHDPQSMLDFINRQPNFQEFYPPTFFNFHRPIPIPKIREEQKEYDEWKKKQDDNLSIFNEMLGEKAIRAGRVGVGEAHKGWGRSKRKY